MLNLAFYHTSVCKMNPNSVSLASGGAFSGILRRRSRRALRGRLQQAPSTGMDCFGSFSTSASQLVDSSQVLASPAH